MWWNSGAVQGHIRDKFHFGIAIALSSSGYIRGATNLPARLSGVPPNDTRRRHCGQWDICTWKCSSYSLTTAERDKTDPHYYRLRFTRLHGQSHTTPATSMTLSNSIRSAGLTLSVPIIKRLVSLFRLDQEGAWGGSKYHLLTLSAAYTITIFKLS